MKDNNYLNQLIERLAHLYVEHPTARKDIKEMVTVLPDEPRELFEALTFALQMHRAEFIDERVQNAF